LTVFINQKTIAMTILFLFFLSGLLLQGLKVFFNYIYMITHLESINPTDVSFHEEMDYINLATATIDLSPLAEDYKQVKTTVDVNTNLKRLTYDDNAFLEGSSDLLGNEIFMQPSLGQTA
jgi:hypothetical protein